MKTYITKQGQMLDQVAREVFGDEHQTTELLLTLNPGLASLPLELPEGTIIKLPEIVSLPVKRADTISLWG